jgi:hypothetical protein
LLLYGHFAKFHPAFFLVTDHDTSARSRQVIPQAFKASL